MNIVKSFSELSAVQKHGICLFIAQEGGNVEVEKLHQQKLQKLLFKNPRDIVEVVPDNNGQIFGHEWELMDFDDLDKNESEFDLTKNFALYAFYYNAYDASKTPTREELFNKNAPSFPQLDQKSWI